MPAIPTLADALTLGDLLTILWRGRWIILGSSLLALLLSFYYVWRVTPIYQMGAMVQVDAKQTGPGRPAMEGKIEGLFEANSQAQAEVLQSNQVLGRVVQALHLDLAITPKTNWFFGPAWVPVGRRTHRSWMWRPSICPKRPGAMYSPSR